MSSEIKTKFVLRNLDQKGLTTLYLQVRFKGTPHKLPIGMKCKKADFDLKNQRFKKSAANYVNLNLLLSQNLSRFNDIVIRYTLARRPITFDALKIEFLNPESAVSFLLYFKHKLEKRKAQNKIVFGTWKQHNSTLRKLTEFKSNIQFKEINLDFIYQFEKFLIDKHDNNAGTIGTRMRNLQVYINLGISEGLMTENPFGKNKYKIQNSTSRIISVTVEERQKLIDYYFSPDIPIPQKNVLQGFLLSCFTGLRYSDLSRVSHDTISQNILRVKPIKTIRYNKTVLIPLIPFIYKIIEPEGKLCKNIIQNQPTNRTLKIIGEKLKLETPLTTHVGRHSFGSLFIQNKGNVVVLQKIMGHSDIKETLGYVHLHESFLWDEMNNFGNMIM
jgi:site-specific recombinase XerD